MSPSPPPFLPALLLVGRPRGARSRALPFFFGSSFVGPRLSRRFDLRFSKFIYSFFFLSANNLRKSRDSTSLEVGFQRDTRPVGRLVHESTRLRASFFARSWKVCSTFVQRALINVGDAVEVNDAGLRILIEFLASDGDVATLPAPQRRRQHAFPSITEGQDNRISLQTAVFHEQ